MNRVSGNSDPWGENEAGSTPSVRQAASYSPKVGGKDQSAVVRRQECPGQQVDQFCGAISRQDILRIHPNGTADGPS